MAEGEAANVRRARLRRSDCSAKGLHRVRRGKGFSYVDAQGRPHRDAEDILRIKHLAIPPAWEDVWICVDPLGHLQATGVDAAGRKQYRYHDRWRELRDRQKFDHMVDFARALPQMRRRVLADLREGDELDERRVLACALRLLDIGLFRIGSDAGHVSSTQCSTCSMTTRSHRPSSATPPARPDSSALRGRPRGLGGRSLL